MLRVVIADDEERICQLIFALGEWQRLGLEVVGVAHNGLEALEKIQSLSADILITDIRMPGLSGLEVVNRARELLPRLEVIIISGYAQFDYAQTAIQNGVGEYLLKPINREALNHTLQKMADSIRERQRQSSELASALQSNSNDRERLRQKLCSDLWLNLPMPSDREQLEQTYHFESRSDAYRVLLLKTDCDTGDNTYSFMDMVTRKAMDLLSPVLRKHCTDAVCQSFASTLMVLVNVNEESVPAFRQQLRNALNQMVAQKGMLGVAEFSMALSAPCLSPEQLADALHDAQAAAAERLVEGTGRLLEGSFPASGALNGNEIQARYAQAVTHAIDVMSAEEAQTAAEQLRDMKEYPNLRGWEMLEIVRNAGRLFLSRLGAQGSEDAERAFLDSLDRCGSFPALITRLEEMQQAQFALARERQRDQDAQPIRNAKVYIHKHYAEAITLEEVSAAIGFSVNYFSTLFKKENGEGFAKYLTKVRMEAARNELRETNDSVTEICNRVGYGDVKHFTKTFKSETGLTPSEYRKLYG